ncbi:MULTISPECIES: hypothetical protein [Sphingobacterium]|uniref:hypothetical protein n=1 Tax=Sphingobacterium TaxID=28453 RepID=UPI00257C0F4E|nr:MULTISPECIES: hypothetical protein [Sphingobacterium]
MKKFILISLIVFCNAATYAQQKKTAVNPYKDLSDVSSIIQWSSIHNKMSELPGYDMPVIEFARTAELLPKYIEMYNLDGDAGQKKQAALFKKYQSKITDYINGSTSFGETRGSILVYNSDNFQCGFVNNSGSLTFFQTGIYSKNSYNTIRLNSTQRALSAAKDVALPTIYNFSALKDISEIKHFLIIVGYTSKDFTSDSVADSDAETIGLLVSKNNAIKYINAEFTDEQLLKNSILYNINSATGGNIKKISTQ